MSSTLPRAIPLRNPNASAPRDPHSIRTRQQAIPHRDLPPNHIRAPLQSIPLRNPNASIPSDPAIANPAAPNPISAPQQAIPRRNPNASAPRDAATSNADAPNPSRARKQAIPLRDPNATAPRDPATTNAAAPNPIRAPHQAILPPNPIRAPRQAIPRRNPNASAPCDSATSNADASHPIPAPHQAIPLCDPNATAPCDSATSNADASHPIPAPHQAILLLALLACPLWSATRPHYGGTLRVETRQAPETQDPPAFLGDAFHVTRWEAGRRAVYEADDSAPSGRPFLDSVDITLGRSLRDQSIDFELGKTDIVELGPNELRRQPAGRKVWSSLPVRVLALVFAAHVDDPRVREALALAVDRSAIHAVLLQRQGEVSGALLPQWLSGYAFLFPTGADLPRARELARGARPLTLAVEDAAARPIAERIALNARDAGLNVSVTLQPGTADVRLAELRIDSTEPAKALAGIAAALGAPEPARADSPEALFNAERALLDGYRVIPLIHLPDIYGVAVRVRGAPGITPVGEWRFEDLWLEGPRP